MNVHPEIIGYWEREAPNIQGEMEYLTIDDEGRIIHEILDPDKPGRILPVRLWCRLESGSQTLYQVAGSPTFTTPWPVQMKTALDRLVVDRNKGIAFEFSRKTEDEIPVRFKELILQSRETMSQKERELQ